MGIRGVLRHNISRLYVRVDDHRSDSGTVLVKSSLSWCAGGIAVKDPILSVRLDLKPKKQQVLSATGHFLAVNKWLYKVEQYFDLIQLANATVHLLNDSRVSYATTRFTDPLLSDGKQF